MRRFNFPFINLQETFQVAFWLMNHTQITMEFLVYLHFDFGNPQFNSRNPQAVNALRILYWKCNMCSEQLQNYLKWNLETCTSVKFFLRFYWKTIWFLRVVLAGFVSECPLMLHVGFYVYRSLIAYFREWCINYYLNIL